MSIYCESGTFDSAIVVVERYRTKPYLVCSFCTFPRSPGVGRLFFYLAACRFSRPAGHFSCWSNRASNEDVGWMYQWSNWDSRWRKMTHASIGFQFSINRHDMAGCFFSWAPLLSQQAIFWPALVGECSCCHLRNHNIPDVVILIAWSFYSFTYP